MNSDEPDHQPLQTTRLVKFRRIARVVLPVLLCAAVVWLFLPVRGSIRSFDPDVMARREATMWKHYYEKRFVRLAFDVFVSVRTQYRLSPWNAGRIGWDLAKAAKVFQASRSRAQAEQAIPIIERAYQRLARSTNESFDARRAATLELEWWQQRREHAPPELYFRTIASLACEIYSCDEDPKIDEASLERARMMKYRDTHGKVGMTESDWLVVQEGLLKSYRLFHEVLMANNAAAQAR